MQKQLQPISEDALEKEPQGLAAACTGLGEASPSRWIGAEVPRKAGPSMCISGERSVQLYRAARAKALRPRLKGQRGGQ